MIKELLSTSDFQWKFFKNIPKDFHWQQTPLQVYPLDFVARHILAPIPLFQSSNNYIVHIQSGKYKLQIDAVAHEIQAPGILVVLSGTVQGLHAMSEDTEGHVILIEGLTLSATLRHEDLLNLFVIQPVLKLAHQESDWIDAINKLLHFEVTRKHPNRKIAEGLLQALLHQILELSTQHKPLKREQQIAISFKQLVYKNFKTQKEVAFFSDELHISANYLNRCVKSAFGKSCKEIILETIVLQGQLMLWDMSKSIAEISFACNMDDPSYFSRIFKRLTGYTPSAYRDYIMHDLS